MTGEWAATLAQGRWRSGLTRRMRDFEQPKGILSAHLRDEPEDVHGRRDANSVVIYGDPKRPAQ